MIDTGSFLLFLAAALLIALTPGPGIFYVAGRTLAGGRAEGLASSYGTGLGGLVHVAAGALGVSALMLSSAQAFAAFKLVGAVYLVGLGIAAWRSAAIPTDAALAAPARGSRAFRQGVIVEATNPKTAAFFLAFIPQFIDPAQGRVPLQFALLGIVSVTLNTLADVAVTYAATLLRDRVSGDGGVVRRLRKASACVMCGLGVSLAFARRG